MFSSGGRRSSLRSKTPGRTPGPSRFSVGPGVENGTPAAVPRRFMDFERPSFEAAKEQAHGNVEEGGSRVRRTLDGEQADKAEGAAFGGGSRMVGSVEVGNGPDSNVRSDGGRVSDFGSGGASRESEALQRRENVARRRADFESPGTDVLVEEVHVMEEAIRPVRGLTAVNESVGMYVEYREENRERAVTAVNPRGEEEVWRRFRGAGALDEEVLVRREKEELQRQLEEVEREVGFFWHIKRLTHVLLSLKCCLLVASHKLHGFRWTMRFQSFVDHSGGGVFGVV